MSTWLSEERISSERRKSAGVTINVAFLQEIKSDSGFRDQLTAVFQQLKTGVTLNQGQEKLVPRVAAELLGELRDGLETYFALEEFYGYFQQASVQNPCVGQAASGLQAQHESLFLELNQIVETTQQIVYNESGPEITLDHVAAQLDAFCTEFNDHEQAEMDLMMRLCNEDFGVGD